MNNSTELFSKNVKKMILLQVCLIILGVIAFIITKNIALFGYGGCFIKENYNLPCIVCGVTRCIYNMVNLNLVEAFKYHPIFFVMCFYILFANILYIINTLSKKDFLSFFYRSMIPFYVFLVLFIVQYLLRLILFINQVEIDFMYINI